jgi:hypothetical protein
VKQAIWLATLLLSLVFIGFLPGCNQSVGVAPQNAQKSPAEAIPSKIYAVQLNNPTTAQLIEFLRKDPCDRCAGNCVDRAQCLVTNSYAAGIEAYVVTLNFKNNQSHVIVGYKTTDGGFVYVEPLYDKFVTVEIGKDYGEQLKEPGYIIEQIGVFP